MLRRVLAVLVLITATAGMAHAAKPGESNLALCKRLYAGVNKHDNAIFDELMASTFVEHEELPGYPSTSAGVKDFFAAMYSGFPDLMFDVEFYMVDGDKVAAYLTINGTNTGEFLGKPATGNKIHVKGVDILQFKDGRIVAHWGVTDGAAMMQQLSASKSR
ncbi:MAG: ester cyclase [bacterium]